MAAAQKLCIPYAICLQQSPSLSLCRRLTIGSTSAVRARKTICLSIRPRPALILMNLPSANPEWTTPGQLPKWSARALKSFSMAEAECRRMKYPKIGTECLLMGILTEGTSNAAKFLRANGVNLFTLREQVVLLLGKSDYRFMTQRIGVPVTEPAQKALDWAVGEKIKSGKSGEITTTDMILAIWAQKGSAGERVLATFGFDDEKLKELESMEEEAIGAPKQLFSLRSISS